MNELVFTGINIRAFINEILSQTKDTITKDMTKEELKAFDFGIETIVSQLEQYSNNDENFVVMAGDNPLEEFSLDDLLELKDLHYEIEVDEDADGNGIERIMVY